MFHHNLSPRPHTTLRSRGTSRGREHVFLSEPLTGAGCSEGSKIEYQCRLYPRALRWRHHLSDLDGGTSFAGPRATSDTIAPALVASRL